MISALLAVTEGYGEALPIIFLEGSIAMPECNMDMTGALVERYERGASEFSKLMGRVPAKVASVAAADGGWSVHQTALHIVDAEIVGATRLRMIAAQPGAKLASYAGDVWGRELAYSKQPLASAIELFRELRRTTTAMLRLLPSSAWLHRAEHEETGEVTLQSYLDSHCEHAEIHMREIEAIVKKLTAAHVEREA